MIDLTQPVVTEALAQWRSRKIFPTDLSSVDLRGFSRELRMRSVFFARTTNADYLGEVAEVLDAMLSGKISLADGRLRLLRKLRQLGYEPETGFPADMAKVPPAERDALQDLSSATRLNLLLETSQRVAANYGRMVEGNAPYALWAYPAWELVRLYLRDVPRGTPESRSAGWAERWHDAGEAVGWQGAVAEPWIARKDSPIWLALGEGAGGYTDTLDNPFPPFAFNSGMAWRAVGRERCLELGLVGAQESSAAMRGSLTPGEAEAQAVFRRLAPDVQAELRRELNADAERETLRRAQEEHARREQRAAAERQANLPAAREAHRKFLEGLMA